MAQDNKHMAPEIRIYMRGLIQAWREHAYLRLNQESCEHAYLRMAQTGPGSRDKPSQAKPVKPSQTKPRKARNLGEKTEKWKRILNRHLG